jgi:hypothetical protein
MADNVQVFSSFADFYKKGQEMAAAVAEYGLTFLPPLDSGSTVHDNASGPGVVSFVIADKFVKTSPGSMPRIYGTDLAPGMVEAMGAEIEQRGLQDKVSATILDSRDLKDFENGKFTHSFTNLAIMMDDNGAQKMAAEIYRTLSADGGTAVVTTWERSATELMDCVSHRIRPGQPTVQVIPKGWETKEKLVDTLVAAGFSLGKIDVYNKETKADFGSEEERLKYFCHPFWGMWRKGWTDEEVAQWEGVVKEELVNVAGKGSTVGGRAWVAVATK